MELGGLGYLTVAISRKRYKTVVDKLFYNNCLMTEKYVVKFLIYLYEICEIFKLT